MNTTGWVRRRRLAAALAMGLFVASPVVLAVDSGTGTGDKGTDIVVNLVLLRPMGLLATGVGSVVFLVSLPFTLASGGAGSAACELVGEPLAYTFTRPLGEIDGQAGHCVQAEGGHNPAP